jgi:hypothetical protein
MKKATPIKRPKRKKNHLRMMTWNGSSYQPMNMPGYLADDYIREFVLTEVPGTKELESWIAKKTVK